MPVHNSYLKDVKEWPCKIKGQVEIIDCGDPADHRDVPSWATGHLVIDGDIEGPSLFIEDTVFFDSCLTFNEVDSGITVEMELVYEFEMNKDIPKGEEVGYKVISIKQA